MRVARIREIIGLPVGGSSPYHPRTRTVKELQHAIPACEAAALLVPFVHLLVIYRAGPELVEADRKVPEPLPRISFAAVENDPTLAVRGETVCHSSRRRDLPG